MIQHHILFLNHPSCSPPIFLTPSKSTYDARQLPPQYFGPKSLNNNTLQQLTHLKDVINSWCQNKMLY